jgi:hypothetical protein
MSVPLGTFFPLYDNLYQRIKDQANIQLTEDEIKILNQKIQSLDKYGRDMIFVWIRLHSLKTTDSRLMDIPFGGQKLESKVQSGNETVSNVKFDLREFPPALNRMLDKFCDLHLSRMSEEAERVKIDQSGGSAIRPISSSAKPANPENK